MQVVRVPDDTPRVRGVVTPPAGDDGLVATAYTPPDPVEGATVLSVLLPAGGSPAPGGAVDPAFKAAVEAELTEHEGRLADLENAPPPAPSGPAGGDLAGFYPNPTVAQSYALSGPTQTALDGKRARVRVRPVSTSVTAEKDDLLLVTTGSSVITIAPPPNLTRGDQVTVMKVDTGTGRVVFNDDTNSDATTEIVGQWSGATLTFTDPNWIVHSVASAYSAPPAQGGTGGGGLTREQADQRYDPIGAATAAVAGVTKASLGLGNVANIAPENLPLSNAANTALAAKAPYFPPFVQNGSGTFTVNAANGPVQAIVATGNLVLAPPSNPSDMQALRLEVFANSAPRTVSIVGGIVNATSQPLPFTVGANRFAVLGLTYSLRAGRWLLVSYIVEPGA